MTDLDVAATSNNKKTVIKSKHRIPIKNEEFAIFNEQQMKTILLHSQLGTILFYSQLKMKETSLRRERERWTVVDTMFRLSIMAIKKNKIAAKCSIIHTKKSGKIIHSIWNELMSWCTW